MIKKIFILSAVVLTFTACDLFKIDNQPGPNATVYGDFVDSKTKELVQCDVGNGTSIRFTQLDEKYTGGTLTRVANVYGSYTDKMFFAGKYRVAFQDCNFFPFTFGEVDIHKGDNKIDFEVTPYLRIVDPTIVREGNTIKATFRIEGGKPEVRLRTVSLYAHTDIYVGNYVTTFNRAGEGFQQDFGTNGKEIDANETYTLTLDLTNADNREYFKFQKNYYFRIGALASGSGLGSVGTIRWNYAPHVIINFGTN